MKNSIIFLFAVLSVTLFSCGDQENSQEKNYCHTELIPTNLTTSVVGDMEIVRTGQSISGIVKDHKKQVHGYTKEMFLKDNPNIANRKPYAKMNPCDSTKISYVSIPVYSGDTVFLRLALMIDTLPGEDKSIKWHKSPNSPIHHIIDQDENGWVIVEDKDIVCDNSFTNSIPPKTDYPSEDSGVPCWYFLTGIPNWFWVILIVIFFAWFIRHQHKKTRDVINSNTNYQSEDTRRHVSGEHSETRNGMSEVAKEIGKSNELLQKILENGQAK